MANQAHRQVQRRVALPSREPFACSQTSPVSVTRALSPAYNRRIAPGRRLGAALLGAAWCLNLAAVSPILAADAATPTTATNASGAEANAQGHRVPGASDHGQSIKATAIDEDARVEQRVGHRLAWDRELAPYDLKVSVNDGVVNLNGSVSTTPESHRARRIAEEVAGANAVVNAIYVDPALVVFDEKRLQAPSDDMLKERIVTLLRNDAAADFDAVRIDVRDGEVQLAGSVSQVNDRTRAERIIGSMHGVERIDNELSVEGL